MRCEIESRAIRRIDVAAIEQNVASADQFGQARRSAGVACGSSATLDLLKLRNANQALCPFGVNGAVRRSGSPGRRFDFLHGRAEIGEQARAIARRGRASDLDNPQMRQRAHHASPWPNDRRDASRRFSFLLLTMKPRPPADASGIFFRNTEFVNSAKRLAAIAVALRTSFEAKSKAAAMRAGNRASLPALAR